MENDLYVINVDCQLKSQGAQVNVVSSDTKSCAVGSIRTTGISMPLWHRRLGHIPITTLKRLSCFKNISVDSADDLCIICPLSNKSRLSFPLSNTTTTAYFHILHANLWGPYRVPTCNDKEVLYDLG